MRLLDSHGLRPSRLIAVAGIAALLFTDVARAAGPGDAALSFLWIAVILVVAKAGTLVERLGQPVVLGEIVAGVALASLALGGAPFVDQLRDDAVVRFLAELGAVILLFQIGLESDVRAMRKVGLRATLVALVGVAVPFALGTYIVGPALLPGMSDAAYLFLGAALTATSVGITGRVFRDAGSLQRREAQIVLGAAVIDDVLGLIILAVVSSIASRGAVDAGTLGITVVEAFAFLVGALVIGQAGTPYLSRLFAAIDRGPGMKLTLALAVCLVFAYVAHAIGLAPIVGAFAAGLVLDEVALRRFDAPRLQTDVLAAVRDAEPRVRSRVELVMERHRVRHLEDLVEPVGLMLVPIFFVMAGLQVNVAALADPGVLGLALALTVAAIAGKLAAGLVAGDVDRWLVGWGMVPRGEVGLIFAFVGKAAGVLDDRLFSVIVLMVILTTLVTPPVLSHLLSRRNGAAPRADQAPANADL